ncbi:MAG TPA: cytochrome P450 [Acidimicrobiales bacterium]|nr:cytochrome P450 [Acidimicrobiales bacterium]
MSTTVTTSAPEIDLLAGAFYVSDPYPAFAWMRANAPAYYDERNGIWGISRYEDVRAIGQDPGRFSSAQGSRPGIALPMMIDMDAPEHRRRRRLVSWGFTPQAVTARSERITRACDAIIDRVAADGHCDLVADIATPLPLVMIADMLGFPEEDWGRLLHWSDTMLMSQGSPTAGALERATEAFVEWDEFVRRHIEDRRRRGTSDDLLGALVNGAADGERLDVDSLVHEALLILIGGDETTRHVISGGMEALLRHPEQLEALRSDRSLLGSAVEEMLRWVSPIKNMNRTASAEVELHGRTIRAGDCVLLLYPSANRDERVFADPDSFDIRRSPNEHLAFGFGAHLCLGQRLARAELVAMVDRLLERLPDLALRAEGPLPLRESNFIVGLESMPVAFSPVAALGAP